MKSEGNTQMEHHWLNSVNGSRLMPQRCVVPWCKRGSRQGQGSVGDQNPFSHISKVSPMLTLWPPGSSASSHLVKTPHAPCVHIAPGSPDGHLDETCASWIRGTASAIHSVRAPIACIPLTTMDPQLD